MNILVLDVGTSSMRGILMDAQGSELAKEQIQYTATYLEQGWVEQDPDDWRSALFEIVTKIAQGDAKIDAITMTSQRSSVIPIDQEGNPLSNAIMWQDKRTASICKERESLNDEIFSLCGSRVNPVFSAGKMTWLREQCPELYAKVYKFIVIPDYLNYLMTGELKTDHTYGSRSLLMNLETRDWDSRLLQIFNVDKDKLCELVPVGSIIGTTTEAFMQQTGLTTPIPVITAGGDQQCGAIGQGVVKEGVLSVTAGTGGFLITMVPELPQNLKQDVICNCASVEGQYVLESNVLTCCSAYDWFRKEFYPATSFEELNREIEASEPGAGGCICVPYFQGRSTPDWNTKATASWSGVTLGTHKRDMLRSLWEGICCEIGNGIHTMMQYTDVREVQVNGGLTNSDVFNQMQSDVYNMPVMKKGSTDATARGAFMVAATTLGLYDSIEEAYEQLQEKAQPKEYMPDPEKAVVYKALQKEMNEIYHKLYQ